MSNIETKVDIEMQDGKPTVRKKRSTSVDNDLAEIMATTSKAVESEIPVGKIVIKRVDY